MLKNAVGLALAAPLALGLAAPATAQSVEAVLARHYEAIGGLESWTAVESMRMSGKMAMGGMAMEAPFTMVAKRPGKARMEFTIQGMTGIQGTDGQTAWMVMPFMGRTEAERMPAEQAKAFKQEADLDGPLVGYEESGHTVELVGTEEVEGTETYKLQVTYPDGRVGHYYLDAERYLPLKIEDTREVQGDRFTLEQNLGDYREVDGLVMAHTIEVKEGEGPVGSQVFTVEEVELNVPVDDSLFTMPGSGGSN